MLWYRLLEYCCFLSRCVTVDARRARHNKDSERRDMPPKKKEVETAEPVVEDPAVLAARAERERQQAEDRKTMDRNELIDRRRVEALEQVSWRIVQHEKEKRLDPSGWNAKMSQKGPSFVYVKTLTGNRGMPPVTMRVPITADTTVLLLKNLIRTEATRIGQPAVNYVPEKQKLFFLTKEVAVPDEYNCGLGSLGIFSGSTIHVALDTMLSDLVPSQLHK